MPLQADVLIAGAGPAGSTLARLLPAHLSVILLERRNLAAPPAAGEKPCGGLIAPDAQKQLFYLGLSLPPEVLCGPQIFGVLAHDFDTGLVRAYPRHYLNIHRPLFDRMLFSQAAQASNVVALTGKWAVGFSEEDEAVTARLNDGGQVRARLLVGADGAGSAVRGLLGDSLYSASRHIPGAGPAGFGQPGRLLAMQRTFRVKDAPAAFEVFFQPELTDFYAWSIPKGDTLLVGLAAPWRMPGPRARMDALTERLFHLGRHTGEMLLDESCALLRPGLMDGICPGRGRVALIGEAGGFVSPSSAEGVSFALKTAQILADAVRKHPDLSRVAGRHLPAVAAHRQGTFSTGLRLRAKWAKFAAIHTPLLRAAAMRLTPPRLPTTSIGN